MSEQPPLYGFVELSKVTGMSTSTLSTLLHRARRNREAGKSTPNDIPEPDHYFGSSPVWKPETVQTWLKARVDGPNANRVKRVVDPERSVQLGEAVPLDVVTSPVKLADGNGTSADTRVRTRNSATTG